MFLAVTLLFVLFLTLLLLLRLRSQMAALVAWIVGTITGSSKTEDIYQETKESGDKEKTKPKNKGQKSKKTLTGEPSFSTTLTTPIEDIIEETINEETTQSDSIESKSPSKSKKRNRPGKKKSKSPKQVEDDIGFSFFNVKSPDSIENREQSDDKAVAIEFSTSPTSQEDPLGFSFLPVKKSQRRREKIKVDDLPQSSLIEHYQSKKKIKNESPSKVKDESVVLNKIEDKTEEQITKKTQENLIELVNKSTGRVVYVEAKESKKVHSKISYASVASQRFEESLERLRNEEKSAESTFNTTGTITSAPVGGEGIKHSTTDVPQTENQPILKEIIGEAKLEEDTFILINKSSQAAVYHDQDQISDKNGTNHCESETLDQHNISPEVDIIQDNIKNRTIDGDNCNSRATEFINTKSFIEENSKEEPESQTIVEHIDKETEVDKDEELADEIESEKRRLVDLLEEGQSKGDEKGSVETEETSSETETLEEANKQQIVDETLQFVIEQSCEYKPSYDNCQSDELANYSNAIEEFSVTIKTEETTDLNLKPAEYCDPTSSNEEPTCKSDSSTETIVAEVEEQILANISDVGVLSTEEIEKVNTKFNEDYQVEVQEPVAVSETSVAVTKTFEEIFTVKKESSSKGKPLQCTINSLIEEHTLLEVAGSEELKEVEIPEPTVAVSESQVTVIEKFEKVVTLKKECTCEEQSPQCAIESKVEKHTLLEVAGSEELKEVEIQEPTVAVSESQVTVIEKFEEVVTLKKESTCEEQSPQCAIESKVEEQTLLEVVGSEELKEVEIPEPTVAVSESQENLKKESSSKEQAPHCTIESKVEEHTPLEVVDAEEVKEVFNLNKNLDKESLIASSEYRQVEISKIEEEGLTKSSKPFKMSSGIQVRVLTLNDKEHQDSTLYRIEKNWVLQFRLGPSLLGRKVSLYCNYPKEGQEFNRTTYQLLKWSQDEGCNYSDDTALLTEITPKISGSFHYYFTYENGEKDEHQGSGFFLVDPVLSYGNNENLPLDCIQCQTFLAKSLGPFDTWENKLRVAKESGYNMIHFTPIQELGVSNSSYSLSEQLKVNPLFTKQNGEETTFEDIEKLIVKLRTEWKVVSICDVVLNHTANESEWLREHPEVIYNCQNCPYMRPSYLLDAALHQFSLQIARGDYEDKGIPVQVATEEHLNSIRYHLRTDVLAKLKLHEMFTCDVNKYLVEFLSLARGRVPPSQKSNKEETEELKLVQDPLYRRLAATIDMQLALKLYNVYRLDCFDEETRLKRCAEDLKSRLESLNKKVVDEVAEHLDVAVDNVVAAVRYFRVQPDGPRIEEVSAKNPLVSRYFTDHGAPADIEEHERVMYGDDGRFLMAHNGWVMNSDPLRNFAAPGSHVYLRRELISWGDSVKLRFGDKPEDSPFLWDHMRAYVEQTARIFDGIRLDNCHSTPIPVAEYLLDCARKVRPDLYVVAELFTNSDLTDNIFVNRLGITSLIREAMSAWDSHEQGRLVYRYGGSPVGSFYQPRVRPLVPSIAHALFLDLTHDNPSPVEKRSVFDLLPSTALVNMACCASGSNRGYDELVPHHIHVVDESRQYSEWAEDDDLISENSRYVTKKSGLIAAKKALNDLHFHLGLEGFNQVYVDQMDPDVVAVTRHCPETHQSYVLVAFTAFSHPPEEAACNQRGIRPLRIEGVLDEIVLEATLSHVGVKSSGSKYAKFQNFHKDSKWINGLSEYQVDLKEHIQPDESEMFDRVDSGTANVIQLNFKNFKPGSIAVVKVSLPEDMNEAIKNVRKLISQFSMKKESELSKVINEMTLPDLNRALYRCDQEERDEGYGFDAYNIPNFGPMVYTGLQGFMSLLSNIRPSNDLGHPMCGNLRDGNWMIDYIWQRLKLDVGTKSLGQWFEENTKSLKMIPRYLIPCYFDVILTGIYVLLIDRSYNLMSDFVKNGSAFVRALALGSVQFAAYIKSADLPALSPNLAEPKPPLRKNENGENVQACVTLSAGLPHFSVGYMRNWGRDTFIALRGLFLLTGRYQDARYHILGYAACLRHGLIPNLLDGGRNSRFNCRDAVWWWLYCIKCYAEEAPDGLSILSDRVSRIFPKDDSAAQPPGAADQPLHDVIQEALNVHFQGLVFRERNAGRQIDEHMSDQGFNNQIGVHPETGFVFGGNALNCGTWMDKMGSSDKAGNRGKPATPRDGSAVELVGLSKAGITWLDKLHRDGVYPYSGVERTHKTGTVTKWTFAEWADKIQKNFEKYFWVDVVPEPGEIRPDLINKRGIYKDCHGASQEWTDFQLRCNFPVAMVVAPELFSPQRAWIALQKAEKYLLGPLGMKTLDPEDWAYNGNYDNSNDSDNFNVAHGFNYHQGPEWVWPVGFYLRAKLQFAAANGELAKTVADTKVVLSKHFVELQTSAWRGLPELTNQNGAYCKDSSRTQAWSMSSILEALYDLQKIEKNQPLIN